MALLKHPRGGFVGHNRVVWHVLYGLAIGKRLPTDNGAGGANFNVVDGFR